MRIDLSSMPLLSYRKTLGEVMTKHEDILANRAPIYGEARINLACTQELCDVFDKYYTKNVRMNYTEYDDDTINAHKAAIHLVMTKLARIATGQIFHEDNYLDGSNYIEIGRKIMLGESTIPKKDK